MPLQSSPTGQWEFPDRDQTTTGNRTETETGTENTETTRNRTDRTGDNPGLGLFQDNPCLLLHGVYHFVEEQRGVVQRGQTQGFYPLAELGLVLLELHHRRRVRSNDEALFKQV